MVSESQESGAACVGGSGSENHGGGDSQDGGQGRGHGTARLRQKLTSKMARWPEALVLQHVDLSIGQLT